MREKLYEKNNVWLSSRALNQKMGNKNALFGLDSITSSETNCHTKLKTTEKRSLTVSSNGTR